MRKCAPADEYRIWKKLHTRIASMEREKTDDLNYTPAIIKTQCAALNYVVDCNKKFFCELYTRAPTLQ